MYISKLELNNKKFKGTLDFYVIKNIQQDLKENNFDYKVKDIFLSLSDISNLNMFTIASLVLNSINRLEKEDDEIIEKYFIESVKEDDFFVLIFTYINNILDKCMPDGDKSNEIDDLFEDDEEFDSEDWDFDYMEYLWYSILKRSDDFYKITPKNFFKQMDIWKKANNIEEENVNYL